MNRSIYAIIGIIICFMVVQSSAFAQSLDARSMGMGAADTAAATGVGAVYWNPANLANSKKVSIAFPQVNGYVSNNVLTGQDILNIANSASGTVQNNYFDNFINAVSSSGWNSTFSLNAVEGLTIFNFGLTMNSDIYGSQNMSKDAVGFMLRNQTYLDRKMGQDLAATGTSDATALVAPTLTYATSLFGIDAGINLKPYSAGAYGKADVNIVGTWTGNIPNPYLFTGSTARAYTSTSPSGFGVDIGLGYNINKDLRVGFVVQNLGGDITWVGREDVTTISVATNPATGTTSASQSTTTTNNVTRTVAQNTTYRIGVSYNIDLLGPTLLTADYEMPTYTKGGLHAGAEKYFGPVALRLGVLPDVNGNMLFSVGTGLQIFAFGFNLAAVMGDGKSIGGSLGMTLDF